jgi:protein TonB
MASASLIEQLDHAIDFMVASPEPRRRVNPAVHPAVSELLAVAAELRYLPSPDFKARLKADLLEQAYSRPGRPTLVYSASLPARNRTAEMKAFALPSHALATLSGAGQRDYPVQRANFVASFALHAAAMALLLTSGYWVTQHRQAIKSTMFSLMETSPYALPPATTEAGGGGGGGDRDKVAASKGSPPKFAREQFTPPAVVLRNPDPKLTVEPTVVGPPELKLAQMPNMGDPMSKVMGPPSNGTGSGGGIGDGSGGGVGSGRGPGVGPGYGGGIGGGIYRVGGGVSAPRAIYDPDPEYSEEARQAKYQGTVVLWVIVGADGRPHDMRVERSLGMGLDQKAIDAVRTWKFEPARKDGHPVAVQINVEVNFRLY